MVKQQLRVLCFINYSHLPSSGGEGATQAPGKPMQFLQAWLYVFWEWCVGTYGHQASGRLSKKCLESEYCHSVM